MRKTVIYLCRNLRVPFKMELVRRSNAAIIILTGMLNTYFMTQVKLEKMTYLPSRIQLSRVKIATAFENFCKQPDKTRILELCDVDSFSNYPFGRLAYADDEFDWAACYEMIECLDSTKKQFSLLVELMRIARLGIFVSTVNRRHPIDMQSGLPFIHWLKSNKTKKLLDADDIKSLANNLPCNPAWELGHVRYAGIKSYFFLMIKKESTI